MGLDVGTAEKPGLEERHAAAVNAGSLAPAERHQNLRGLVAVDRLGAFAMAMLRVRQRRGPLTEELAGALWRAKYAGCERAVVVARVFLGAWVIDRPVLRDRHLERVVAAGFAEAFASRAVYEWLHEWCTACRGTGYQEIDARGRRIRPRGLGQRNARLVVCRSCGGERIARPNHGDRIRALEIDRAEYSASWVSVFALVRGDLVALAGLPIGPLRQALSTGGR